MTDRNRGIGIDTTMINDRSNLYFGTWSNGMAVWVLVDQCFVFKDNMSSTMRMNCIQLRLADGTRCIKRYIPLQSRPRLKLQKTRIGGSIMLEEFPHAAGEKRDTRGLGGFCQWFLCPKTSCLTATQIQDFWIHQDLDAAIVRRGLEILQNTTKTCGKLQRLSNII